MPLLLTFSGLLLYFPGSDRNQSLTRPSRSELKLEVELVDIGTVEDGWRAKQHHVVRADGIAAQFASREGLADVALDLALNQQSSDVVGQVAQVGRVPQLKGFDCAILHILAQLIRRSQAGQGHLPALMHRFERAGGGSDAHRRGGDDALQVRVLLEQGQRLVEARSEER